MTIGMPELSDQEDVIEVEFEERENGGTQMFFFYQSLVERERRLTTLEYKQRKGISRFYCSRIRINV